MSELCHPLSFRNRSSAWWEARAHWGIKDPTADNYAEYRAIQEAFRENDRYNAKHDAKQSKRVNLSM